MSCCFFKDTATTDIYTLSLHDALPICCRSKCVRRAASWPCWERSVAHGSPWTATRAASKAACSATRDRKSTRLNSSHLGISYAVFCLKKKKKITNKTYTEDIYTRTGRH